jgi:hypothetical protein
MQSRVNAGGALREVCLMKSARIGVLILPLFVCLVMCQAIASESGKTHVTLDNPTVVKGTLLQPGDYLLKWTPGSPECQATFYSRGKPVLEVRAKLIERDTRASDTTITTIPGPDGKPVIKEIRVGGKKTALVMD